jgi:hypothetical protein
MSLFAIGIPALALVATVTAARYAIRESRALQRSLRF